MSFFFNTFGKQTLGKQYREYRYNAGKSQSKKVSCSMSCNCYLTYKHFLIRNHSCVVLMTCQKLDLVFMFLKFYDKKYFVPERWEAILAQSLILKICFLITCFNPDAALPQVFNERSKNDSKNEMLDLLVYSKCPIKWNSGPHVQNTSP